MEQTDDVGVVLTLPPTADYVSWLEALNRFNANNEGIPPPPPNNITHPCAQEHGTLLIDTVMNENKLF